MYTTITSSCVSIVIICLIINTMLDIISIADFCVNPKCPQSESPSSRALKASKPEAYPLAKPQKFACERLSAHDCLSEIRAMWTVAYIDAAPSVYNVLTTHALHDGTKLSVRLLE